MEVFEQEKINQIIAAYLENRVSGNDLDYLENWIKASGENREYFLQLKNISVVAGASSALKSINTETALNKVLARISKHSGKVVFWQYWQKVAAVLLVPVLVLSIVWNYSAIKSRSSSVTYNEIYAAFGTRSAIKLSDGSKVWLNSGSSLRYPDKFTTNLRTVFLKGEAYFEVQSDKSKPFIVQTEFVTVKATGTKFNVTAFENTSTTDVSLLSGKVAVHRTFEGKRGALLSDLKPNQLLIYNKVANTCNVTDQDVSKFIAWKDGKLIFRNEPLSKVVEKISRLYNVDIELQGKELQEYRYRATFEEESLNEILRLLKLSSPINYLEVNRKPLPNGTFPKRKIIIFPVNK